MPTIQRAPNEKELEKLRKIFLKAETDIINEIGRLRSMGNIDYHAVAALNRVQAILKQMETDAWEYVPQMIEKQFYVRVPEARRIIEPVEKHIKGYANAEALTATQYNIIDQLTINLMAEIVESENVVMSTLKNALIGRTESDVYRRVGLELVAKSETIGKGAAATVNEFVNTLLREGVTAFVDKAGRNWSLHTYANMVCRTTSRQAEVLAVLTADESQDLYQISSHGTTCHICAPLEGRVYSRSGKDPNFPPLALAFGKIDPNGADDLTNSYLNIHPNCLVPGGLVLAEGVMAHTCREYNGAVIVLQTAHGNRITVTPNHPILTTEGFIPAGMLRKGQKVIEATGKYPLLFGETPNNINIPTPIEKIKHTIIKAGGSTSVTMEGASVQFHGDGIANSKVNVVFSKGFGINKRNILANEPISKKGLPPTHFRRFAFNAKSSFLQIFKRTLRAPHSVMSCFGFIFGATSIPIKIKKSCDIRRRTPTRLSNFFISKTLIVKLQKFSKFFCSSFDISRRDVQKFSLRRFFQKTIIHHSPFNCILSYSKMFRQLGISEPLTAKRLQNLFRDDGLVVSELVHVSTSNYCGKVYNLETVYGFYVYNNIVTHNCQHVLLPWTPMGRTEKEIKEIQDFSSFKKNPITHDPRTEAQVKAYRDKEQARAKWLSNYRQWEKYKIALGDKVPKTFETFQRHKIADDEKYQEWLKLYREVK